MLEGDFMHELHEADATAPHDYCNPELERAASVGARGPAMCRSMPFRGGLAEGAATARFVGCPAAGLMCNAVVERLIRQRLLWEQ